MEEGYTARNIRRAIGYRDFQERGDLKTGPQVEDSCSGAYKFVAGKKGFGGHVGRLVVGQKNVYTIPAVEPYLATRLLDRNLISVFRVKPADRASIVRNLVLFLKENSAYSVHRLDIKSFFESVDRKVLYTHLVDSGKLSKTSLGIIQELFNELERNGIPGLPRGLSISSTFSEILLKPFDKEVRKSKLVFYYARFVDDIILITSERVKKSNVHEIINSNLPKGLKIHDSGDKCVYRQVTKVKKSRTLSERRKKEKFAKEKVRFSYLGYEYTPTTNYDESDSNSLGVGYREVFVDISDDKLKKIKDRLILSFANYISQLKGGKKNLEILELRVKFLSGNFMMKFVRNKAISYKLSGYHFNYPEVNVGEKTEQLDGFLRYLLFSNKKGLPRRIRSSLSLVERRSIARNSFANGRNVKAFYRFSYRELQNISRIWK